MRRAARHHVRVEVHDAHGDRPGQYPRPHLALHAHGARPAELLGVLHELVHAARGRVGAASLADGPLPPPDGQRDPHDRSRRRLDPGSRCARRLAAAESGSEVELHAADRPEAEVVPERHPEAAAVPGAVFGAWHAVLRRQASEGPGGRAADGREGPAQRGARDHTEPLEPGEGGADANQWHGSAGWNVLGEGLRLLQPDHNPPRRDHARACGPGGDADGPADAAARPAGLAALHRAEREQALAGAHADDGDGADACGLAEWQRSDGSLHLHLQDAERRRARGGARGPPGSPHGGQGSDPARAPPTQHGESEGAGERLGDQPELSPS
mmetsp:Transcript_32953/g.97876  ORF Transcript_32953/g.97876 Transcript_32953/m.97876 type:complete len:327 (-) Transcript_32953:78-1058(-)